MTLSELYQNKKNQSVKYKLRINAMSNKREHKLQYTTIYMLLTSNERQEAEADMAVKCAVVHEKS